MYASDIIVHSATEPEPFGRVIVEGMLAGKPVIATAAGGPLDIISHNENGVLVPLRDSSRMAQAITRLLLNRQEAETMGAKARQAAESKFNVHEHVAAVQSQYMTVLKASSS